ncbi:MAG TPA: elongation factor G [Flavobacteriales bacterium]|jgi:elongation factor G|nr:elongation factor G [Flavobacteriales bacterium]
MKIYDNKHIKNVAFVGAHGSGKTTLAETMLYEAGLLKRRGNVESKNTVSDFTDIEKERQTSIFATPLHTEWRNYKINIIDTPGLDDFIGEVISAMRVSETALMVVNGQHGAEVGTEIIWNYIDRFHRPTVFVINQIDHPEANFDEAFNSIVDLAGKNAVKIQFPYKMPDGRQAIIDVLKMKMYVFGPEGGKPEKHEIPEEHKELADTLHNELVEKAAENDEELMELFFEKGTLNEDEMKKGIKKGMLNLELFPVFAVSALNDMGSGRLMGFIDNVTPSALDMPAEQSMEGEIIEPKIDADPSVFVFKTKYEPNVGKISYFKVKSGEIKTGDKLMNGRTNELENLGQLYIINGKQREPVDKLVAGDIGAVIKLKSTETSDTLHDPEHKITFKPIQFPAPRIKKVVKAANKNEEEKLQEALKKIHSQDPTVVVTYDKEMKQQILGCQGELHLAIVDWILQKEYGIKAIFEKPRISYRETIQRSASSSYRHKKQSGGAGQFGEVHLKIEPYYEGMPDPDSFPVRGKEEEKLPWGGTLMFINSIVGGVIDSRYLPSIKKGILEVMESGPLTKSPVRDVRVIVYDGKMHPVDSNDISFKIAGANAFKQAFLDANPKLLEPIQEVTVKMPEEMMGSVMTDLQGRRAIIMGMETAGKYQQIKARVPLAEMYRYSTTLRSLTQGRGTFTSEFVGYELVPQNIQEELIKQNKEEE